jgi:type III secretion protein N (ATPase)
MTNQAHDTRLDQIERWLNAAFEEAQRCRPIDSTWSVLGVRGTLIEARVPDVQIGELCELGGLEGGRSAALAEVVGFSEEGALLSALSALEGVSSASYVRPLRQPHCIEVGPWLLGSVLDGFGRPLGAAARGAFSSRAAQRGHKGMTPVIREAMPAYARTPITKPFHTGVTAIDAMLTMGVGQRIGIFAGPGCGKTTLISAISRGADVDAIVFGLVGERGRELREFLEHELDAEQAARSVVVIASSDKTPMERCRAAFTATAIAEGFRDQGYRVLLLIDSLTRLARAQREIGLAAGEPPARAGFPPSVYALLPRLIERAGQNERGAVTAIYTVLEEGGGNADPIAEEARSLLDGHIVLSRKLAEQGHFPAIDLLASLSRVMSRVAADTHVRASARIRELLATHRDVELLVRLGEYRKGTDERVDRAVDMQPKIMSLMKQDTRFATAGEASIQRLLVLSAA